MNQFNVMIQDKKNVQTVTFFTFSEYFSVKQPARNTES